MLSAALKSLLGRKVRLLMSTFAIVLGVSFVAGTLVFSDTLNRSFTALFASTVGDVVVEPDAGAGATDSRSRTIPAALVDELAALDGADRADGNVLVPAAFVVDRNGRLLSGVGSVSLGSNWTGAPAGHGLTGLQIVSGRAPQGPGEVVLDRRTAERAGHAMGQEVPIVTSHDEEVLRPTLVGIADFPDGGSLSGATWVAFDTRTAQRLFLDDRRRFHSAWVTAAPGTTQEQLRNRVAAVLPDGVVARTGDEVAEEAGGHLLRVLSFLTTFLLIFAGISLVVGAFLIVNTFSILVAQRSRELALFRALGASRRQVTSSVLLEALVLGLLGSSMGIILGVVMAMVIRSLFGQLGLDLSGQELVLHPRTFVASYLVGVLVTLGAAWLPARRSARIAPVQAMRDDVAMPESSVRNRFVGGLMLLAAGGVVLTVGLRGVDRAGWYVGAGILAILLGVAAASPVLSQPFLVVTGWLFAKVLGPVGRLAGQNSRRNPRRTTATASALMIGLALAATMSIVGDSAKASVDQSLEKNFRGDYVISSIVGQPFSPRIGRRVAKLEGVQQVVAQRFATAVPAGVADDDVLLAQQGVVALEREHLTGLLAVDMVEGRVRDLGPGRVVLGESHAARVGLGVGDTYDLVVNGAPTPLEVVGVFIDNPVLTFPVVTVPRTLLDAGLPDQDSMLVVKVDTPTPVRRSAVERSVEEVLTITVLDQASYAEEQRRPIDQMVTMIYALLGLALLIAVLGIVNTLALSVIERTKEIGLLRAIGLNRAQVRRMITVESVVIAALGAVLGLVLGVGFGVALMHSLRDQGLDVVSVPWNQLGLFLVVALVVGVLAAVLPARRAANLDVLAAIASD